MTLSDLTLEAYLLQCFPTGTLLPNVPLDKSLSQDALSGINALDAELCESVRIQLLDVVPITIIEDHLRQYFSSLRWGHNIGGSATDPNFSIAMVYPPDCGQLLLGIRYEEHAGHRTTVLNVSLYPIDQSYSQT